jgi:3-oxoacyl-[acyl-carrier protein] reductase
MLTDFTGKVALVTGAGRGIGRAVAQRLAEGGAKVLVTDLDADVLKETASLLGAQALAIAGDITDAALPERLVKAAVGELGGLDILVNNAGYTWDNVIQKTTDEQFQAMLDVHVVAPFRVLRAAAEPIRARAKAEAAEGRRVMRKVVNITSISGMDGIAGQAGYGSGKAGIIGLTKVMAKEWGRYNVNVNAVGFGFIETRLTQARRARRSMCRGGRFAWACSRRCAMRWRRRIRWGDSGRWRRRRGRWCFSVRPCRTM